MATASFNAYKDNSTYDTFQLVSTTADGCQWKVASRDIALPYSVTLKRKIGSSGKLSNDHVLVTISRTERNSTTGMLVTGSATLDISIPRDSATVSATTMRYLVGELASILNDDAALAASNTNRFALVGGNDL